MEKYIIEINNYSCVLPKDWTKTVSVYSFTKTLCDNFQEFSKIWCNGKDKATFSKMSFWYYIIAKALRIKCFGKRF